MRGPRTITPTRVGSKWFYAWVRKYFQSGTCWRWLNVDGTPLEDVLIHRRGGERHEILVFYYMNPDRIEHEDMALKDWNDEFPGSIVQIDESEWLLHAIGV